MTPTTVYLTKRQLEMLRVYSKQSRIPMAVLIREAIDAILAKWQTQ